MADRSSIFELTHIGIETTPGTAVTPTRTLAGISVEPELKPTVKTFRPLGNKFLTAATKTREWTECKLSGVPTYNEIVYLLSSLITGASAAQQGGTTAYLWTFSPSSTAGDSPKTLTVEQGSSVRAHQFAYAMVTELSMTFSRADDSVELSGQLFGQQITDGYTLTGSPTQLTLQPISPEDVTVYLADTQATLATADASTRVLKVEVKVGDRHKQVWTLNQSQTGYVANVEGTPSAEMKLLVEADSNGMALLTTMRNGAKKFCRVKAVGGTIVDSYSYTLQIDWCGFVDKVGKYEDKDGVYAIEFTLSAAHDTTWGKALEFQVQNELSAL